MVLLLAIVLAATKGLEGLALGLIIVAINELAVLILGLYDRKAPGHPNKAFAWLRKVLRRRRQTRTSRGFPSYEKIIADLSWAKFSLRDFDMGIRKRLLGIATVRLSDRYGVDIEQNPDAARQLLGEKAWSVLRPDQPPSDDRTAPGIPLTEVAAVVTALENLKGRAK